MLAGVFADNAMIVEPDIFASNGYIQGVDDFIAPADLIDEID